MESAHQPADGTLNKDPQEVVIKREPERDLITWTAPSRVFRRYGRKAYVTLFSIVGIVSIIIFIAEGLMPVILLAALVFLFYTLSTIQPENIEYKITNRGIKIAGKETKWQEMTSFWFITRTGGEILGFDTIVFPSKMELVINPEIKDDLKREISAYLPYEEKTPSAMDKLTVWFSKKILENE